MSHTWGGFATLQLGGLAVPFVHDGICEPRVRRTCRHNNVWMERTSTVVSLPATTGLRERGNDTSRSTGRSGRQKAATRRNMRREERVTVQGPVKEQQPNGMSHRGGGGGAQRPGTPQPLRRPRDPVGRSTAAAAVAPTTAPFPSPLSCRRAEQCARDPRWLCIASSCLPRTRQTLQPPPPLDRHAVCASPSHSPDGHVRVSPTLPSTPARASWSSESGDDEAALVCPPARQPSADTVSRQRTASPPRDDSSAASSLARTPPAPQRPTGAAQVTPPRLRDRKWLAVFAGETCVVVTCCLCWGGVEGGGGGGGRDASPGGGCIQSGQNPAPT